MFPSAGSRVDPFSVCSLQGETLAIPAPSSLIHLQFRRFAGCPICSLHLRQVAARIAEIRAAGIREVVFFHAGEEALRAHEVDRLPFACIADPDKVWYRAFGIETSWRASFHPRALWAGLRSVLTTGRIPLRADHGLGGLPADLLIAPDGTVLAARQGTHAADQWGVDTLLELASAFPASLPLTPIST